MYTYFTEKESQDTRRQSKPNQTGIPTGVKRKYEAVSGKSFDDVRIHYNSNAPLQLRAYAYTRGNDVYIAPGQEKYLGHELGHVVQQKKGMVRANTCLNGIPLNTEERLEREADRFSRGVSVRSAAGNASVREDVAQLAPIDWETLKAMWESGYSIPAIAALLGLSAIAIYELIQCLRPGKEEKGTSVLTTYTTSPVRSEDDSVRRRDTRSKAPVGKKEISRGATSRSNRKISRDTTPKPGRGISGDTTPKPGRGISGDTTPRLESEILEDTAIRSEGKPPRDATPVIPPPVTGVETIRLSAGSGEGTVIPESAYVSDEPKLLKRKRQKGNGRAELQENSAETAQKEPKRKRQKGNGRAELQEDSAETARKEPKRKRQKGNGRAELQEDPAKTARKASMDDAVAEVLGPGEPVSLLGNHCTRTPCAPQGLFTGILFGEGWIAADEKVCIYHDTGRETQEGKRFYLGIRGKAYFIFWAKHSETKGRNNKNYTIRSVNEDLGQEWKGLLEGKSIWFVGRYMCISRKGNYL